MSGSVPPLPPRRTISSIGRQPPPVSKIGSTASSDAQLLQSVPPPPQHTKYRDLIAIEDLDLNQNNRNSDHQNNNNSNQNDNTFESQVSRPQLFFNDNFSLTKPELRLTPTTNISATISSNQSYIQWQNKSIPPNSLFPNANIGSIRPPMWSYVPNNCTNNNSFSNYSYSSSAGVSPVSGQLSMRPLPPLSHSMSAPNFSSNCFANTTYSYSYSPIFQAMTPNSSATTVTTREDIQKLVTNGQYMAHNILVNKISNKVSNNDLIDLIDTNENKDILELFDPLTKNINNSENNELNFSNNFELDSDSSTNDEIDKSGEESPNSKSEESIKELNKTTDVCQPFRVVEKRDRANEELEKFCGHLVLLRRQYQYNDYIANIGLVISPTLDSVPDNSLSVKLIIDTQLKPQSISFTCNVNTSVEHIISQVIVTIVEEKTDVKMEDYLLKVYGLTEYFAADSVLADYSYVHQCHKLDKDVHLSLIHIKDLIRPFARTATDDQNIEFTVEDIVPKAIFCKFSDLKAENFNILLDNFDREIIKLRADARMSGGGQLQPQSIIQTTKAICMQLSSLETISLTESHINFEQLCKAFGSYKRDSIIASEDNSTEARIQSIPDLDSKLWEILDNALLKLKTALAQLIRLYSQTFPVEFDISSDLLQSNKKKTKKDISSSMDTLVCQIGVCCQLPPEWLTTYKEFKIRLQLIHGNHKLSTCYSKVVSPSKSFFYRLSFDEWLQLDWPIFNLPREVKLEFTIIGIKSVTQSEGNSPPPTTSSNTSNSQESTQELGVGTMCLFDYKQVLTDGQYLIPLWINSSDFNIESDTKLLNTICFERTNPILQIAFPEMDYEIRFPSVVWDQTSDVSIKLRRNINSLDSATQTELFQILNRNPLEPMSCGDREQLWDRRYYLYDCAEALPKVLLASHSWEWSALADIYAMVQHWSQLSPVDCMQLLLPSFPDIHIRQMTVKWLKKLSSDELCDFLPQLVQALRFDAYIDSPLVWFLFESCLSSVRVCHYLYWILKCNINDQTFAYRSRIYLNSLLAISGMSTKEMINRQEKLCDYLSSICSHIKSSKESQRLNTLLMELVSVNDFLTVNPTVLPLSPSMLVCGLDVKLCSYFPSNSLPLKLVFKNPDTKTSSSALEAIFKAGDDLRQDMLSMQMIQIMDKVWLKAGLDLRMITFGCIATDYKKGMIEMVPNSETLRKIQLENHGLTGSFKAGPIAEWLKKHNTSELEYHKAVENFMYSCAGYTVATYLLGICDRHNDNIMLTTFGHLFHIDFGKFLGDSQMMAGFKRDRVPFVLTSDMAYVINGGDKPSKQFQFFIDICCQAFNMLRKNGNFLLSLFSLMMSSRICGLNIEAVQYIHRALMPGLSESEAMSQFTRMIEDSLRSRFTKFNFFFHNLAQMRFTGDHNDQMLLSFVPKKFTKESDGEITNLEIIDCFKKYETEVGKVYYYVVKVERQFQSDPNFIYRTYREFLEFNEKLNSFYPLAKFHALPRPSNLIRSNTRDTALQRTNEIHHFIKGLMLLAHEISHADIVYTFFHPLLRDQEGSHNNTISIISPPVSTSNTLSQSKRDTLYGPTIAGQVKLSIIYKNMSLVIMIMHAKNLHSNRSAAPDCYVKTYLTPDQNKGTKRKTRVVNKSCHPTFMEMIVYNGIPLEKLQQKTLQVSVWDYDRVTENVLLGGTHIVLSQIDLKNETCDWFPLQGN